MNQSRKHLTARLAAMARRTARAGRTKAVRRWLAAVGALVMLVAATRAAEAPKEKDAAPVDAAPIDASQRYDLRYRFSPGEVFRCRVTHLTTVDTSLRGVSETAQTRSVSTKAWKIVGVDASGNVSFTYTVEDANMWQQLTGRQEIRYDSSRNDEPPDAYRHVAETIGVPLGTITISPAGEILRRENARPQFNPGIGELTIPLPRQGVKVGENWSQDGELPIRLEDGRVKRIKIRHVYELKKVRTGVATITVRTEVLTPVDDPAVQSQLVQRQKRGEIRFDVDAGRVLQQQMDIDETVIGFNGPDSRMKYLARLTEETLPQNDVARHATPSVH